MKKNTETAIVAGFTGLIVAIVVLVLENLVPNINSATIVGLSAIIGSIVGISYSKVNSKYKDKL